MNEKVKPVPEGYTTVTPWIIGNDTTGLMDFLTRAFGAVDLGRVVDQRGKIGHAEMRIGDAVVMMFDAPDGWPETPAFIRLYLDDADATMVQALNAGATEVTKVTHLAFGDRVGRVRDPFGNLWWLQTRVENVSEEEVNRRWSDPEWMKRMEYVQNAKFFHDQRP